MTRSPNGFRKVTRLSSPLTAAVLATGLSVSWPIVEGTFAPVLAQELVGISAEFRAALQPYGRWEHHSRWGEVWVPADRPRDWRPYTVGHWGYTDDWGWYWISDQEEDAWGWVAYHYGHWVLDADFGWIWVPGTEWGPGWVQWRRGTQDIGWAPLPPDEVVTVFRDEPRFWIFVRSRDFLAPRITSVIVPVREYDTLIRETVVENRTVDIRDRRIAVNPGISPDIVAAAVGRPLRSFEVHPRVLAGTARLPGAIEVRAQDIERQRGALPHEDIRETRTEIRPAARISEPQPLSEREQGRLGPNPPRAARDANLGTGQTTTGPGQPQQQPQQGQRPGQNAQQPLPPREQQRPGAAQQQERRQPPNAQGLAPRDQQPGAAQQQERRQPPNTQGLAPRDQQPGAAQQQERRQPPNTPGLAPREQQPGAAQQQERRQPPSTQGLAPREPQPGATQQQERRPPPSTQGLGGGQRETPQPQVQPQSRAPQEQPRTEGRGGGAGQQRRPGGP
jgi:hypothetical protein